MSNKYLEKLAGLLGTNIIRPVENLVNRTKQMTTGLANRERAVNMGVSAKPLAPSANKLGALKNQSNKKMWSA